MRPALLTSTSIGGSPATEASIDSRLERSTVTARALSSGCTFAVSRAPSNTSATGSWASRSAIARPIPRLAPVTRTVVPERSMVGVGSRNARD